MNTQMEWFLTPVQNAWFTASFLNIAMKSFVLLALAAVLCVFWRRASAATRHLIWFLSLVSLISLPALTCSLPAKRNALWSVYAGSASDNQVSLGLEFVPGKSPTTLNVPPQVSSKAPPNIRPANEKSERRQTFAAHLGINWLALSFLVWGAGVLIILISLLIGPFQLRNYRRHAKQLQSAEWLSQLAKACKTMGLGRPVTLLQSADNVMPLTWGWWHPVVLLPAEAVRWPDARRQIVLLHELAHVKRRDCLTQFLAEMIRAFYWFNPLVWLAVRQMRAERERACDDLVLNAGCKASDYAGHLVDIAGNFRGAPQIAAIAMARPSGLGQRVEAILDARRNRGRLARLTAVMLAAAFLSLGWLVGSQAAENLSSTWTLKNSKVKAQLKHFVAEKAAQEASLIKTDEDDWVNLYGGKRSELVLPNCQPFFDAAGAADWPATSNLWSELKAGVMSHNNSTNGYPPHGLWLQPVTETYGAVEAFAAGNGKYSELFGNEVIQSIPPGSIYFGGTDPGRFIVTLMEKSQVKGEPFFTITQNALADGSYLHYLRLMYGDKIYVPSGEDSQKCFETYVEGARRRAKAHQLKPGEDVRIEQGRVQVSGQVAVMQINGLLAKVMFDRNTNREFFVEESFPLDWMYPHLEPHGLIFKINRQPIEKLPDTIIQRDQQYWTKQIKPMIGGWLKDDTSAAELAAFAKKVFEQHDLGGFTGDPSFVQNSYTAKMYSKLRASIGGLYIWRQKHTTDQAQKQRLMRAADFAFRQAWALCPYSSETLHRYVNCLLEEDRVSDALLIAKTTAKMPGLTDDAVKQIDGMIKSLKQYQEQSRTAKQARHSDASTNKSVFQLRLVRENPSADTERMTNEWESTSATGKRMAMPLNVEKQILLDQHAVKSAIAKKGLLGNWEIEITFAREAREKFAEITRDHVRQRLAIIIDGKLMEAPVIQSEIPGGTCQIVGDFSEDQAKNLAAKINNAAGK